MAALHSGGVGEAPRCVQTRAARADTNEYYILTCDSMAAIGIRINMCIRVYFTLSSSFDLSLYLI